MILASFGGYLTPIRRFDAATVAYFYEHFLTTILTRPAFSLLKIEEPKVCVIML
jgi:hypothetical protein